VDSVSIAIFYNMRVISIITRPLILLGFVVYVLTGTSLADVTPQPVSPTPDAIPADPDLRSPRSTIAYFLAAMELKNGDSDLDRAIKALDVSELPELVRDERSRETAIKLYAVLTYKDIAPSKVPNVATASPLPITEVGPFILYLEQVGPNWRFSKSTVRDTPDIFREIEHNLSKKEMRKLGGQTAVWLTIRSYVPEQLKGTTLILEDWHWIAALLTLAAAVMLHFTLVFLIRRVVYKLIPSRLSDKPAQTMSAIRKPIFVIVFTSALQIFLSTFDLQIDFYTFAITWISTVRILATTLLAIRLIPMFTERVHRIASDGSVNDDILYPLVEKVAWLCIIMIGAVQILWTHGVNVSGLAAGLGLGGLAFALAAKDTVENIFGAVAILIDQPFKVGDNLSMSGITGTVEHIGLRSTRLRTPENSLLSLPNSKIIASHVDNLGARTSMRVRTILNLPLSTPPTSIEALCGGLRAILSSYPSCVKDSIVVHFNEFNASSLGILVQFNLTLQTWAEEQRKKEEVFLAFIKLIQELELSLAVPTQEVIMSQPPTPPTPLASTAGIDALSRLGLSWK
jgi:MscS family membrane protein